jgi:flavorubredoxin
MASMETEVTEIADRIYRLATFVPGVAGVGLGFNQFLIDADEPALFHCGPRGLFGTVSAAAARIMDIKKLRWIMFSHVESDECGALDEWMAAAPNAIAAHGRVGCNIWLNDMAPRPPRALADNEVVDLGGRHVRRLDTAHLPHCWDAGLIFEETTGTLFTSDLFTQVGERPAMGGGEIVADALKVERMLPFTSLTPSAAPNVRRLAALKPKTLAIMHGSSYAGDCPALLEALAADYAARVQGIA